MKSANLELAVTPGELRNAASIEALFENFNKVQTLINSCYERLVQDMQSSAALAQTQADVARIQADSASAAAQSLGAGDYDTSPTAFGGDPEDLMMAELHAAKLRNIELNTLMRLMAEARMMLAEISKMRSNDEAIETLMRAAIKAFVGFSTAPMLRSLRSIRNTAAEGAGQPVAELDSFMSNELPGLLKEAGHSALTATMKQAKLLS